MSLLDDAQLTGAGMIAVERQRQIHDEGWTPELDADHLRGDLAAAAVAYAMHALLDESYEPEMLEWWPWPHEFWKPKGPIRDLQRAGALIAAEIDRRLRDGDTE